MKIKKGLKWVIIISMILLIISLLISEKEEKKEQRTTQEISKKEEVALKVSSKYENYKTIATYKITEQEISKILNQLNVNYTIEDAPLADNTPRKILKSRLCSVEFIGIPEIKEASIMFAPSSNFQQNLDTIAVILSSFKALCNPTGNENNSKIFMNNLNNSLKNNSDKNFTIEKCKIKIKSGTKEFPLWLITFVGV